MPPVLTAIIQKKADALAKGLTPRSVHMSFADAATVRAWVDRPLDPNVTVSVDQVFGLDLIKDARIKDGEPMLGCFF